MGYKEIESSSSRYQSVYLRDNARRFPRRCYRCLELSRTIPAIGAVSSKWRLEIRKVGPMPSRCAKAAEPKGNTRETVVKAPRHPRAKVHRSLPDAARKLSRPIPLRPPRDALHRDVVSRYPSHISRGEINAVAKLHLSLPASDTPRCNIERRFLLILRRI